MKNCILGITITLNIVLILLIAFILNFNTYVDDCFENNVCEVRIIKVKDLMKKY